MCKRGVVRGRGWMMRGMVCSMMPMMRWQMVGSVNETVNWKIKTKISKLLLLYFCEKFVQ